LQFGVLTKTKDVSIETHTVPFAPASLARIKRVIARVWQAIQAENFYPNPSAMNCSGCPYRTACRRWSG
jgi:CRISPR/Cas system-associated exonuclease Cas4 (RecB family)